MTQENPNSKRRHVRTRNRKAAKWGGAVVTVLLIVAWLGSGWRFVVIGLMTPSFWVTLEADNGSINCSFASWDVGLTISELSCGAAGHDWEGLRSLLGEWDIYRTWGPNARGVLFPIWSPMLIVLACTCLAWRADVRAMRRARVGLCAACGYDLAGTAADAVCPECGKARSA